MQYQPVNILGGAYRDATLPWSSQDTCNWIPEIAQAQGTRTQMQFRGAPGLELFTTVGTGPIRGARDVEGKLFVVSGTKLYEVTVSGLSTERGTIPGVGLVGMAHNQVKNGYEVLIVNGSAGYVWNTAESTFNKITDEGYPGAIAADYVDSYLVQVEPFGRFWFHSDLADAMSYNTLDRYESEADPDKIVTLAVSNFEVVVFNRKSTEFFYNAGGATNTFQSKKVMIQVGCAGRNTVVKLDNTLIFLDNFGRVCRLDGYQAVPISTGALEKEIAKYDWSQAFAFSFQSEGHQVYYITLPGGHTFGYDVVTREWHRRQSYGLDRWRLNTLTYWQNQWIGGDFQSGKLYRVKWDVLEEAGAPLVAERVTPAAHSNQNRVIANYIELQFDTGHGSTADHEVMLDYSDDGGRNWTNTRRRSLGAIGEYWKRVRFTRLGAFRNRVMRIRVSSPCKRDLMGAVVKLEGSDG